MLKKFAIALIALALPFTVSAATILGIQQGGTASSTLTGILVGNLLGPVQSLKIGTGLTFTSGTLSATGGGSFPFTPTSYGVSTSTTIGFTNGILSTASSTFSSSVNFNGTTNINSTFNVAGSIFDGGIHGITLIPTGTSTIGTAGNGINITNGCFAVNSICISGATGSSASSTLLTDNNTFSGTNVFSTNSLTLKAGFISTASSTVTGLLTLATTTTSVINNVIVVASSSAQTTAGLTTNIQNAINLCASLYTIGQCGGVYFPSGLYSITAGSITMASNVNLSGAGESTIFRSPIQSQMTSFFNATNVNNVKVSDMFFSGINTSPIGTEPVNNTWAFFVQNDKNLTFQNVRFEQFYEDIDGNNVVGSKFLNDTDLSGDGTGIAGSRDFTDIDAEASSTYVGNIIYGADTCVRLEGGAQDITISGANVFNGCSIELGNAEGSQATQNITITGNTWTGGTTVNPITMINFNSTSVVPVGGGYFAGIRGVTITGNTFNIATTTSNNFPAILAENSGMSNKTAIADVIIDNNTIISQENGLLHTKSAAIEGVDQGIALRWDVHDNNIASSTGDAIKMIGPVDSQIHNNTVWNYGTNANALADEACIYIGGNNYATSTGTSVDDNNCSGPVGGYTSTGLYVDNPLYVQGLEFHGAQFKLTTNQISYFSTAPTSTPYSFYENLGIGTSTPGASLSIVGNLVASSTATSTFDGGGINLVTVAGNTGCFAVNGTCVGGVGSVSNSDGTLTISPTTGSIVASLALTHANTWTGLQKYQNNDTFFGSGNSGTGAFVDVGDLGDSSNVYFDARGSTSNIGVQIRAKGTGNIVLATGSGSNQVVTLDGTTNFVGFGTTSPKASLAIVGTILASTTATTTFNGTGGINLTTGCFSIAGTCIGGSGTVTSVATDGTLTGGTITTTGTLGINLAANDTWTGLNTFNQGTFSAFKLATTTSSGSQNPFTIALSGSRGNSTQGVLITDSSSAGANAAVQISDSNTNSNWSSLNVTSVRTGQAIEVDQSGTGAGINIVHTGGSGTALKLSVTGSGAVLTTTGGNAGISSSTPGTLLSLGVSGNASGINFSLATSTFENAGGINLTTGCYAINGTCVGGSGGSGTVGSGTTGQFAFYNTNGTAVSATSSIFVSQAQNIGIGTTTPYTLLDIKSTKTGDDTPALVIDGSETANGNADIALTRSVGGTGEANIDFNNGPASNVWQLGIQNTGTNTGDFELWDNLNNPVFTIQRNSNNVSFGTTTPANNNQMTLSTSTEPQLGFSDNTASISFDMRSSGGMFSIATSAPFANNGATSSLSFMNFYGATGAITFPENATSTFADGINLTAGCITYNGGACIGSGSGVTGGTTGMLAAFTSASTLTATSGPTFQYFTATSSSATSTVAGSLQVGTTTGTANFVLNGTISDGPNILQVATSSNQNIFDINRNGLVLIGTSTPGFGALTIGSANGPQAVFSDNVPGDNIWSIRNYGGNFALATSTASATSTTSVFSFNAASYLWQFLSSLAVQITSATALVVKDGFGSPVLTVNTASTSGPIFAVQATSSADTLFSVDQYGHLTASSTKATPSISSCGTGSPAMSANANDVAGSFVTGASASSCTITFGAVYSATPVVVVSDSNSTAVIDVSSISTTAFTISLASALSAVTVNYIVVMP